MYYFAIKLANWFNLLLSLGIFGTYIASKLTTIQCSNLLTADAMKPYTFMTTAAESTLNVNLLYSDADFDWNEFNLPILPSHQWFQYPLPNSGAKLAIVFISPTPSIKFIDCSLYPNQPITWFEGVGPHTKWKGFFIVTKDDYLEKSFALQSNELRMNQTSYPLPPACFTSLLALTGWATGDLKEFVSPKKLIHDFLRQACSSIDLNSPSAPTNKVVRHLEELVENHLEGGFLPKIDEIAQELNMHKVTLQNKFKQVHNKSLYEYYLDRKLERACELLKYFKVQEVAERLGYTQAIKFIIVFKKRYNITPKQFVQGQF